MIADEPADFDMTIFGWPFVIAPASHPIAPIAPIEIVPPPPKSFSVEAPAARSMRDALFPGPRPGMER
jgi:hypothetical protein